MRPIRIPKDRHEAQGETPWWTWLILVIVFGPKIFELLVRRFARKDIFDAPHEPEQFEVRVQEHVNYYAPEKSRRRLWWLGLAVVAMSSAWFFDVVAINTDIFGLFIFISIPVGLLLWRESRQIAPLASISFGRDEVLCQYADGRRQSFPLDERTTMEVSLEWGGESYFVLATMESGEQGVELPLRAVEQFAFLALCRDQGVRLKWGRGAPRWFRQRLLSVPGWSRDDFEGGD